MYVLIRPYVDEFLQRMGQLFECILFTASLAKVLKQFKKQGYFAEMECSVTQYRFIYFKIPSHYRYLKYFKPKKDKKTSQGKST